MKRIRRHGRWGAAAISIFSVVGETVRALKRRRLLRLAPIVLVLFAIGILLMLLSASSPLAPFIYPLL